MKRITLSILACLSQAFATSAVAELPQPGTVVDGSNMERYKEALHPALEYFLRNGMEIPVVEYRRVEWPPAYKEATEKYSAQVRLGPEGRSLENYVAGAPFPVIESNDPQAAVKWMWNHEHKSVYTDNAGMGLNFQLINDRGERERHFDMDFWRRMRWVGRLVLEPKPTVPHDPPITYTEQWGPLNEPADMKGAGVLNFRYENADTPDDSYMYFPELRKVRRLSMANRSDAFWGSDLDIDAIWTWNSKISFWTFRFLGERKLLAAFHSGGYAQRDAWCAQPDGASGPKSHIYCVPHELRDTVIVEAKPTGFSQYAYSKRVLYIDKETYMAQYNEGYDHGGELWRTWYMMSDTGTTPHELRRNPDGSIDLVPTKTEGAPSSDFERVYPTRGGMVDHQLRHTSVWEAPDGYLYPRPGIKHWYHDKEVPWNEKGTFTINYLIKSASF